MQSKADVLEALADSRAAMRELVCSLTEEQLSVPYHPGVNPPLWEMGHAAFFYEIFVLRELDGTATLDPAMDEWWDSFHVAHEDRWSPALFPGREATLRYADAVYERVARRIEREPLTDQALYLYRYAIYHQNMHIESMIWCRQTVGYPAPSFFEGYAKTNGAQAEPLGDAQIPAGRYYIGVPAGSADYARADFAFDNEKPGFEVEMPAFAISRTLVSNGEFLAFVEDGGYERVEFWSQGGRRWLGRDVDLNFGSGEPPRRGRQAHPFYWRRHADGWQERVFDRWLPLQPAYPVKQISYWEAEAYCNWAGRRLPSECEWEVAALGNRAGEPQRRFPWGNTMERARVDMNGRHMGRQPVSALAEGESPFGCRQMIGTVWEWTRDQFLPYDGFAVDMYPFMSTLQFGDHKTTRGGSCASSSMLLRGTYRQAYHPDRADVFTGFRTCAPD